jgi:sugar O-acyltransferase (sialic acid O-acetyltransferase NeuD family)
MNSVYQRPVVIFGVGDFASLIWYCLTQDAGRRVVAFTADRPFLLCHGERMTSLHGLPVVPFDELPSRYPPDEVELFVGLGFRQINRLRQARYEQARSMGYSFIRHASARASIWPDLQLGENSAVFDGATVQPFAQIGNNVMVRSTAFVAHHVRVDDHAFIAAGATLGGHVQVEQGAFVGLRAVVKDGVRVAAHSFVGAGAVLIHDTEPGCVYVGNPAYKLQRTALEVTSGQLTSPTESALESRAPPFEPRSP